MTLADFVRFCRGYADIGDAVTEQLEILRAGDTEDLNPNALRLLRDWLRTVERASGNDEELADEVGGTLRLVEQAIDRAVRAATQLQPDVRRSGQ